MKPDATTVRTYRLREVAENVAPPTLRHVPLVLIREKVAQAWPHRLRHEDFHAVYLVEGGRGLHIIDGVPYGIARGDVYVMRPGSDHTWADCKDLRALTLLFTPEIIDSSHWKELTNDREFKYLFADHGAASRLHLDPTTYMSVVQDATELWGELREATTSSLVLAPMLCTRLLVRIARSAAGHRVHTQSPRSLDQVSDREEAIARAIRTIDCHYSSRIRVGDLAAAAYLSRDRFAEVFTHAVGQTPRDYIRQVRLERAKSLLTETSLPIGTVGRSVGFPDHSTFIRVFRTATGKTPSAFRHQAQNATLL